MTQFTPLRRSLLFVPGCEEKRIEKALCSAADCIILDLEDAVAPEKKAYARQLVADTLRQLTAVEKEKVAVRINPPGSPFFEQDLGAVVTAGARNVMVPKCESPEVLAEIGESVMTLSDEGFGPRLLALVETPMGVLNLRELASSSDLIDSISFGHADFSTEMGLANQDSSKGSIYHARCQVAITAKAFGLAPLDNVCLAIKELPLLEQDTQLGIDLGFEGKLCIHPAQLETVNRLYTPNDNQIEHALAVVSGWDECLLEGKGVFVYKGKMIDLPVVNLQKKVIDRATRAGLIS